ncbi:CGNR zinc finger domain-containing protein [bacterium]|nr:CGNR zinc finger domain-containing protein [bacterium]
MKHAWQILPPFGGHPFLDFLNSIDEVDKQRSASALSDWLLLLDWSLAFDLLTDDEVVELKAWTFEQAESEYRRLLELRETGYRVFSARAAQREPASVDLDSLAQTAAAALAASSLATDSAKGFRWRVKDRAGTSLVGVRLGLALLDLLSRVDLSRLKECGRCSGLFLDHGRGRGRRWCRMQTCGNREKIARHRSQ